MDLWTESLRPTSVAEVQYQDRVRCFVEEAQRTGSLPNLLFFGAPGIGKTSMALAIARDLYGDKVASCKLELNASDERGIAVIRNKVKLWSQIICATGADAKVSYKLVILDEVDMMTPDAQHALRRIMEMYHATTRFILICNYLNQLIGPLVSRCVCCRFDPIAAPDAKQFVRRVAAAKALALSEEALAAVVRAANGDMRQSLNVMQNCKLVYGDSPVDAADVRAVTGESAPEVHDRLFAAVLGSYAELLAAHRFAVKRACAVDGLVTELLCRVLASPALSDAAKARVFTETLPEVNDVYRGAITEINLLQIMQIIHKFARADGELRACD